MSLRFSASKNSFGNESKKSSDHFDKEILLQDTESAVDTMSSACIDDNANTFVGTAESNNIDSEKFKLSVQDILQMSDQSIAEYLKASEKQANKKSKKRPPVGRKIPQSRNPLKKNARGKNKKNETKKIQNKKPKPQWDSSAVDAKEYKLSPKKVLEKKLQFVSKHRHYAKELVNEQKKRNGASLHT
ncbi:hypothetical protein RFI_28881, partial [Reticulomyxa filosa]